jgi:large subunit ribosomal protein L10
MTREEKSKELENLKSLLSDVGTLYVADISGLNAETTSALRRLCASREVKLSVVKNTLLKKAMESTDRDFSDLLPTLKGNTSIMVSDTGNVPAKLIKDFRKKSDKPILKGAWVDEAVFIGDDQLDALSELKSKNELIGEVITLLQSPVSNVMSALQSGNNTLAGLLKTLEERPS